MQKSFIIWLFLAVLVVLFASVNAAPVEVNFLFASASISLALVMVIPLFLGASLAYILDLIARRAKSREIRHLRNALSAAEAELGGLRDARSSMIAADSATAAASSGSSSGLPGTEHGAMAGSGTDIGNDVTTGSSPSGGNAGKKKRFLGFLHGGAPGS